MTGPGNEDRSFSAAFVVREGDSNTTRAAAKDSAFGQCKAYSWEVQCYKLCPEIDTDTNEMKSISATWRTCAP